MSIVSVRSKLTGTRRRDGSLWLELANAHLHSKQKTKAKLALRNAIAAPLRPPGFLEDAAHLALALDDLALTLELTSARELQGSLNFVSLLTASSLCDRLNRIEESQEWLNRASRITTHKLEDLQLAVAQALLHVRKKQPDLAIELLENHTVTDAFPVKVLINYHHARFKAYDSLGQFDKAYRALCSSKEFNRKFIGEAPLKKMRAHKLASYSRLERIIRDWDPLSLKDWKERSGRHQDLAFLIGHPRSGTTLLENILDANNSLISSDENTSFQDTVIDPVMKGFQPTSDFDAENEQLFRDYLNALSKPSMTKHRSNYLVRLEDELGQKLKRHVLLDKNPAITDAGLMSLRLFPNSRFLFAVRDPRAVVWSSFTLPSFGTTWISSFWLNLDDTAQAYAKFTDVWTAFRDKLPDEQKHTTRYEDVVTDQETEGQAATKFLNLKWQPEQNTFYERAGEKHVHSPTYADVAKPVYTDALEKWKNYEEYMEPGMTHLQKHLNMFQYS